MKKLALFLEQADRANRRAVRASAIAVVTLVTACHQPRITTTSSAGLVCSMEARPALQVTVTDADGFALPSSANLRVIARDGAYADTARAIPGTSDPTRFALVYERPGTFSIQARADGYAESVAVGVSVGETSDGCHVRTIPVSIRLAKR